MIRKKIKKLREYGELTDLGSLSRRYFVIGTFDGALTILALVIGAYAGSVAHVQEPELIEKLGQVIFTTGLALGIGLGISSFFGAYESERIERRIERKKLEKQMLTKMKGTIYDDAAKFAILWSSFVHGISPMIASWIPIIPFLIMDVHRASIASIAISLFILFATGMYLGRVAKRSMMMSGLRFLLIGIVTAIICQFVGVVH